MINLSMVEPDNMLRPRITVVGVGGAGCNAINNMIRSSLEGCDFVSANTDAQALAQSLAPRRIQLGTTLSRGLGAGSKPEVGRAAAEESLPDILSLLEGSDMLFVTAGMGGGTGTGAAPVIARAAREAGILTVGVVTKPFHFEGTHRMRQAESGIADLQQYVDTLIVIPNQNLFRIANERTTFAEAFRMADQVLDSGVRGITDLMVMPGFMNLDFADVKTVMGEMGKAMMGTGEAEGDNRAICAAEAAISNPLLDDISMKGARGVLINITGGLDMTLFEVDLAANRIREEVDPDAQIKVGSTLGEGMDGRIRVSVIATGIDAALDERASRKQSSSTDSYTVSQSAPKPAVRVLSAETQRPAPVAAAVAAAPVKSSPVTAAPAAIQQQPAAQAPQPVTVQPATPAQTTSATTSYFTMPTSILPQVVPPAKGSAAAPVTLRTQGAPESQEPEAIAESAEIEPQEMEVSRTAQRQTVTAAPPIREIPPVQQAQRQRTATSTSRTETATSPDMRVTQLTTAAQPAQTTSAPINQRAQSLFQRITGFGMIRPSAAAREIEEEMMETEEDVQPSLSVDPSDRPALSRSESDLLDIPAFLRRQSNH